MQVSDCEQLMRATLTAARILTVLRGMHPVGAAGIDIDIGKWLQRSAFIEDLGEHAHADMARAFFIEMLAHATKDLANRAADAAVSEEPSDAAVRRAAQSTTPAHQALCMGTETCLPDRLLRYFELFILRLQPLTFIAPSGMVRPHPMLDYRIALVIHTGLRLATINSSITTGLDRLRKLRARHAALIGGGDDNCSCRLFVIVWREEFHPIHGKQTTRLTNVIQEINKTIAKEHLSIEVYNVIELQYDATQHELVPLHTVVDMATEPGLKTIAPAEFPTLYADDPQAKLHDFRPGQIVRIERRDVELGYDELYYRMVRKRT